MRYLLFIPMIAFLSGIVFPAQAAEEKIIRDCQRAFEKETEPYWTLLRWMADYRAAINAGYEGCAEVYPDKFSEAEEHFAYWDENTMIEYEQGFEVANVLADEAYSDLDRECQGLDEISARVKETARDAADSQYEKAHSRRLKALTNDGLSGTGEDAILDFGENDSCQHILTTLESYRKHHGSREQAKFVLYTFATEHSAMTNRRDRATREALRNFDKQRKTITYSAFGN